MLELRNMTVRLTDPALKCDTSHQNGAVEIFFTGGRLPPVRSFHDGFNAVSGADQRDVRATVGK
jgi:hypothetical protein